MAQGPRDENQVVVALGSFNGTTIPLKIDHTTGWLKATIYAQALSASTAARSIDIRDENQVSSALGSFNGSPKTILSTHADGYVRAVVAP